MKKCQAIAVCLVALTFIARAPTCFAADAIEASSAINEAELNLNLAFVALAEAEAAGANIEGLFAQLEVAGDFLSQAYLAYRAGDYEVASSLATDCKSAVAGLSTDAERLEVVAERTKTDALVLSGFGLILLLVFGIVGWRILKERFLGHVLEMKPEVEETR